MTHKQRLRAVNYGTSYPRAFGTISGTTRTTNAMISIKFDVDLNSYRLTTPYNRPFVDCLKAAIPAGKRQWDEAKKQWVFSEEFFDAVKNLVSSIWRHESIIVTTKAEAQAERAAENSKKTSLPVRAGKLTTLELALLRFAKALPEAALKRAYREASLEFHPDRGGDAAKQSELNDSWNEVTKAKQS